MFNLTDAEIARLAITLIGGGSVGLIVGWLRTSTSERRGLRASFQREQLQRLYGPLQFYCSQNRALANHLRKLGKAYKEEYCGKNWSDDLGTQQTLDKECKATFDIENQYSSLICKNNDRIVKLLQENFDLVDLDDVSPFQEFILYFIRGDVEFKDGKLNMPHRIYKHAGKIVCWDHHFFDRVAASFAQKRIEVQSLQTFRWPSIRQGVKTEV